MRLIQERNLVVHYVACFFVHGKFVSRVAASGSLNEFGRSTLCRFARICRYPGRDYIAAVRNR